MPEKNKPKLIPHWLYYASSCLIILVGIIVIGQAYLKLTHPPIIQLKSSSYPGLKVLEKALEKNPDDLLLQKIVNERKQQLQSHEFMRSVLEAQSQNINKNIAIFFIFLAGFVCLFGFYMLWSFKNTYFLCLDNGLLIRKRGQKRVIQYQDIKGIEFDLAEMSFPYYVFSSLKATVPSIIIKSDKNYPINIYDWRGWTVFLKFLKEDKKITFSKEAIAFMETNKIPTKIKKWRLSIFNMHNLKVFAIIVGLLLLYFIARNLL